MSGFSENIHWKLQLGGEIFFPVTWDMILKGLKNLNLDDEDSFLILQKNPDEHDQQFLQTTMFIRDSDKSPAYTVQTAEYANKKTYLYEIEVSNLNQVIPLFKNYFYTGKLDIDLFKSSPPIMETDFELPPKPQDDFIEPVKNKNKWGIPIILSIIVIFILNYFNQPITTSVIPLIYYIMMVYNLIYYRKTNKNLKLNLLVTLPIGILGIILLLPDNLSRIVILPAVLLFVGFLLLFLPIGFILQEKNKRKNCDTSAIGVVVGNEKNLLESITVANLF